MFFNELDVLEIRLAELYDKVDYFVLVEAPFTHSGKPKPLYYQENKNRYKKWNDKIIHIVCPWPKRRIGDSFFEWMEKKFPYKTLSKIYLKLSLGRRKVEEYQRDKIMNGLSEADNRDIAIVSDVDEIIKTKTILSIRKILNKNPEQIIKIEQKMYYYFLNGFSKENWAAAKASSVEILRNGITPDYLRIGTKMQRIFNALGRNMYKKEVILSNGGWHFSYVGGIAQIIKKIESISHFEHDIHKLKDKKLILTKIKNGENIFPGQPKVRYVQLDNSFPKYLVKNKRKFEKLIMNRL